MTISNHLRGFICTLILVLLLVHPSPAKACSCGGAVGASDFAHADGVFAGKVIRIFDNYYSVSSILNRFMYAIGIEPQLFYIDTKFPGYSVFFKVDQSWKGVKQTVVEVFTGYGIIEYPGGSMPDCGYQFVLGERYLVYASLFANHLNEEPTNYYVNSMCTRTTEISAATGDLMYLNTLPTLPLTPVGQIPFLQIGIIVLCVTTLIFARIVISRRRYRHGANHDLRQSS